MPSQLFKKYSLTRSPNQPAITGWAEILAGVFVSYTLTVSGAIYFKADFASVSSDLVWHLLMAISPLVVLVLAVLFATRRGNKIAYWVSIVLLLQPSIKFLRQILEDPDVLSHIPLLATIFTLAFSLGTAALLLHPGSRNWLHSRKLELEFGAPIKTVAELYGLPGKVGVHLFKRGRWLVDASIQKETETSAGGDMLIISGDADAEWHIHVRQSQLARLQAILFMHTHMGQQEGLSESQHILVMMFRLFGGRDKNPLQDIKVFLKNHNIQFKTAFWGSL